MSSAAALGLGIGMSVLVLGLSIALVESLQLETRVRDLAARLHGLMAVRPEAGVAAVPRTMGPRRPGRVERERSN